MTATSWVWIPFLSDCASVLSVVSSLNSVYVPKAFMMLIFFSFHVRPHLGTILGRRIPSFCLLCHDFADTTSPQRQTSKGMDRAFSWAGTNTSSANASQNALAASGLLIWFFRDGASGFLGPTQGWMAFKFNILSSSFLCFPYQKISRGRKSFSCAFHCDLLKLLGPWIVSWKTGQKNAGTGTGRRAQRAKGGEICGEIVSQ